MLFWYEKSSRRSEFLHDIMSLGLCWEISREWNMYSAIHNSFSLIVCVCWCVSSSNIYIPLHLIPLSVSCFPTQMQIVVAPFRSSRKFCSLSLLFSALGGLMLFSCDFASACGGAERKGKTVAISLRFGRKTEVALCVGCAASVVVPYAVRCLLNWFKICFWGILEQFYVLQFQVIF